MNTIDGLIGMKNLQYRGSRGVSGFIIALSPIILRGATSASGNLMTSANGLSGLEPGPAKARIATRASSSTGISSDVAMNKLQAEGLIIFSTLHRQRLISAAVWGGAIDVARTHPKYRSFLYKGCRDWIDLSCVYKR